MRTVLRRKAAHRLHREERKGKESVREEAASNEKMAVQFVLKEVQAEEKLTHQSGED